MLNLTCDLTMSLLVERKQTIIDLTSFISGNIQDITQLGIIGKNILIILVHSKANI